MSDHPKTLRFFADGDANHFTILDGENHWMLSLLHNGEAKTPAQIKNVRRLVACWNACGNISTETLELLPGILFANSIMEVVEHRAELLASLDALVDAVTNLGPLGDRDTDLLLAVEGKAIGVLEKVKADMARGAS